MEQHSFLEQALVYLAAGAIAVPIFQRLGLGSVLGYLIAGIVIGPWGLRLIDNPQTVLHFAEFGVVLLLFLVGLELNPRRLWTLRRLIFGLGGGQVMLTIAAVAAISLALGQSMTVALVAGMGFAMSSTAIGLASLAERNLLNTPGGQKSFAVLLFQDIAVIPLMVVLGLMAAGKGGATSFDWTAAGIAVGMIGLLVLAGHYALRPVLRFIANTKLREIFVGFSLLLVLGIAALMEAVGLSMALGAFLAGVLLADSEYRHELELDIEPFKGLLLGLFFIAVGMSIDLGLFVRTPLVVLGLALGIVALKAVILYPLARPFSCPPADALLVALALSQVGEFAFVLFGAASQLLPRPTVDLLNAAVAVSMLTTPLLLMLHSRAAQFLVRSTPRAEDAIDEANPVIVAGFGRFGQIMTRILRGLGIEATVIDHDPNEIELVRRFGWKAYYGDATRPDLLEAAGAAHARLLVVAIDRPEAAMTLVKRVRERYPNLKILVRAHSRTDAFEYAELGVPAVREVFGSALDAAAQAMHMLGYRAYTARRVVQHFRRHDEELLARTASHRHDINRLIALSEQGRDDLAQLLGEESDRRSDAGAAGWT
jgi:monovalent cation:proton antiporter-2 (CPA2) family protein